MRRSGRASARITRWARAPIDLDYELKYTPGEQIPLADALSRMDFDQDELDNDRVCFAINNIYFTQSDLVTQAEIKTELETNRIFQDIMKLTKNCNWKQCSELKKGFEQHKNALTIHIEVIFRGVVQPNYDTLFWQKRMRHILGKTVSTWTEADVWERLHMEWGYVNDQGNMLIIVDAGFAG